MLSSGGMTKRLDRLEGLGLVTREPDPSDRRGVLIRLTPAGRQLIDSAIPAVLDAESELVEQAVGSQRERASVEAGLRRLLLARESG